MAMLAVGNQVFILIIPGLNAWEIKHVVNVEGKVRAVA
jgi:hypothetical protein